MEKTIENIFENLEKWRNFPKYQLERRLDIFISLYLPVILKKKVPELQNVEIDEIKKNMYPEFPLKKQDDCSSDNADYAAFIEKTIYLIELKTDTNSINDTQIKYYNYTLNNKTTKDIFEDIIEIENKSGKYEKYDFLLNELIYGNQISNPRRKVKGKRQWIWDKDKKTLNNEEQRKDLSDKISNFKNIKVIYIIPKKDEKNTEKLDKIVDENNKEKVQIIEFEDIIKILEPERKNDLILNNLCNLLNNINNEEDTEE